MLLCRKKLAKVSETKNFQKYYSKNAAKIAQEFSKILTKND